MFLNYKIGHRGNVLSQTISIANSVSLLFHIVLNALGPRRLQEGNSALCKEADEFVDLVATGQNIDPLEPLMRVSLNFILLTLFSTRTTSIDDPLYKQAIHIITTFIKATDIRNTISAVIPVLRILDPILGKQKKL